MRIVSKLKERKEKKTKSFLCCSVVQFFFGRLVLAICTILHFLHPGTTAAFGNVVVEWKTQQKTIDDPSAPTDHGAFGWRFNPMAVQLSYSLNASWRSLLMQLHNRTQPLFLDGRKGKASTVEVFSCAIESAQPTTWLFWHLRVYIQRVIALTAVLRWTDLFLIYIMFVYIFWVQNDTSTYIQCK